MSDLLTAVVGGAGAFLIALVLPIAFVLTFWLPYMAWSVTRNIRHIRLQMERLNGILEAQSESVRAPASAARPGALGI